MLLTDKEREKAYEESMRQSLRSQDTEAVLNFARAIESAVLAKLKAQEPIGVVKFVKHRKAPDVDWEVNVPITRGMALYRHPLPPDDVVRVAELEAVLRECRDELKNWRGGAEIVAKIDEVLNENR